MSDFGEHLADMAASGYDVSAPVPYRPARRFKLRLKMPPLGREDDGATPYYENLKPTTPAEREDLQAQILKIVAG